jgi:hypothetical protein
LWKKKRVKKNGDSKLISISVIYLVRVFLYSAKILLKLHSTYSSSGAMPYPAWVHIQPLLGSLEK